MKILFAFIFIAISTCGVTLSQGVNKSTQDDFTPTTTTGFRGGLNFSRIGDAKKDVGLHGGLFIESHIKRKLGLSGELFLSRQTCRGEDVKLTTTYLTFPVLLSLHAGVLRLQAGGYLAYLLKAQLHNSIGFAGVTNSLSATDYGAALGLKLDLGKVGVGSTYLIGLENLVPTYNFPAQREKIQSRNLQFILSFDL